MVANIPERGDICYIDSNPTLGHKQNGKRPCIVISTKIFNERTGLAIICPITSNIKKYPTRYNLKQTKKVVGSVLCENIRSIDYNNRKLEYVESINPLELEEILDIIKCFID